MTEIPDYQTIMLPVLQLSAEGEATNAKIVEHIAQQFGLKSTQLDEMLPSGKQSIVSNRVHWAKFYLSKAGLIQSVRRGVFTASAEGLSVLSTKPSKIDNSFLKQFPAFQDFLNQSRSGSQDGHDTTSSSNFVSTSVPVLTSMSPDERIESALQEIDAGLRDDLLDRLFAIEPQAARAKFFEQLVIQLLKAMGYGNLSSKEAAHLGGAGDGGVDGVIHLDALGIDRVYIQAKCYDPDATITPSQVREFAGSLDDKKTTRGVFITTAEFSKAAQTYVAGIQKQIVLIDRTELTRLMVRFGVGARVDRTIEIKKLDEDFFET